MIDIYGHFFSSPSNKVRLCASYLALPYEYHHVELSQGQHMSPDFLTVNPAGRVPAINDDGYTLSQSDAICKYLCAVSGPSKFYPEDPQEQGQVNQWIDHSSQHVAPAINRLFFNRVVAPMIGAEIDESSVKTGIGMLERDLPVFEKQLDGKDYLLGSSITLADITLIASLEPAEMVGFELKPYKEITRWRKTVMAREFYKRVHAKFGAEMPARG